MSKLKVLTAVTLLSIAVAGSQELAKADPEPAYHVDLDTTAMSGTGYLDFSFLSLGGWAGAQATLDNFSGDFAGPAELTGDVSGSIPGTVNFGSGELVQKVNLGGKFGFDASFLLGGGTLASTFSVALFDPNGQVGGDGKLTSFSLQPDATGDQRITVSTDSQAADVTPLPEPDAPLLMAIGLTAMGLIARRRQESARFS
jgi:hypothetical protein